MSYLLCFKLSIIFTMSQMICHIYFVSNYPWFLCCLKPSVILTLSQTSCHITLKQAIIFTLFEANHHVQSVSPWWWTMHSSVINQILYVLSHLLDKLNTLVTLRQWEYDTYLRQSEHDSKYKLKPGLVRHQVNMKEIVRQTEYDRHFWYLQSLKCIVHSYSI